MLSNIKTSAITSNSSTLQESYWYNHVKLKQASGLGRAEYCRKHNLKCYRLEYWERKYNLTQNNCKLLPVKLIANETAIPIDEAINKNTPIKINKTNKVLCKLRFKNGSIFKIYDADALSIALRTLS